MEPGFRKSRFSSALMCLGKTPWACMGTTLAVAFYPQNPPAASRVYDPRLHGHQSIAIDSVVGIVFGIVEHGVATERNGGGVSLASYDILMRIITYVAGVRDHFGILQKY